MYLVFLLNLSTSFLLAVGWLIRAVLYYFDFWFTQKLSLKFFKFCGYERHGALGGLKNTRKKKKDLRNKVTDTVSIVGLLKETTKKKKTFKKAINKFLKLHVKSIQKKFHMAGEFLESLCRFLATLSGLRGTTTKSKEKNPQQLKHWHLHINFICATIV